MLCDGRTLEAAKYPQLFAVLGYLYGQGEEGEGTFKIPDYRGLFLRGVDDGSGMDPDAGSRRSPTDSGPGQGVGSLQCDALQDHTHNYYAVNTATPAKEGEAGAATGSNLPTTSPNQPPARVSSETRPKNIYVNYIIKYRYAVRHA
ncbi:MAG TPA: phage tail protein [Acidobacteriota bacterium]|nr:phage tail protein [Acidobacteriota bacterium]